MRNAPPLVIEAGRDEARYWSDLWRYRELFFILAWRDILVRYKQTVVGLGWALIRPLLTMSVFTVVFGKFAKLPSEGVPYAILVLSALLPWQLFSTAVTEGSGSLVGNASMISKIYFPRIIVPASAVAVSIVDFAVSLLLLFLIMLAYGVLPDGRLLALPLLVVLACIFSLSVALLFSALNVRYRDFRYVVGFIVQFGLFISPVGFSISVVPESWRGVFALNPMVGIIEGFRWSVGASDNPLNGEALAVSGLVTFLLTIVAVRYFRQTERTFADVI